MIASQFLGLISTCIIGYVIYYFYDFLRTILKLKHHGIPTRGNMLRTILQMKPFIEQLEENYNFAPKAKYVSFFDCTRPIIVIRDIELMKQLAIKNAESFVDHHVIVQKELDPLFGLNVMNLKGNDWQKVRTLLTPAFTPQKMKYMFDLMTNCAKKFADCVSEMATENGRDFEMRDIFTKFGNDVIATCGFGIEVDSMRNPENKFYVLGNKAMDFEGSLSLKIFFNCNFPRFMRFFKIKLFGDDLTEFFRQSIQNTIRTRDEQGISRPDMLQLMMEARGTSNEINLEEMTAQAFGFYLGGFETTTVQMAFLAYEIAVNPEIQEKLREEIDDAWVNSKGDMTYDVVKSLSYLDKVVSECLRMFPVVSVSDRVCTREFELPPSLPGGKPYKLKPGDMIWFPIAPMLHDEQYFPEPEKFEPERKLTNSNQPPYLPFGIGPRMCMGSRFATLQMKIGIIHLLLRCNFEACSKTNIPMKYSKSSFMLKSEGGFWLKVTPRRHSPINDFN